MFEAPMNIIESDPIDFVREMAFKALSEGQKLFAGLKELQQKLTNLLSSEDPELKEWAESRLEEVNNIIAEEEFKNSKVFSGSSNEETRILYEVYLSINELDLSSEEKEKAFEKSRELVSEFVNSDEARQKEILSGLYERLNNPKLENAAFPAVVAAKPITDAIFGALLAFYTLKAAKETAEKMQGHEQGGNREEFPAEEGKPSVLWTPEERDSYWVIETFPVDDSINHLEGFNAHPKDGKVDHEYFPIHDGGLHIIFEYKIDGKKFQEHHIISDKNKLIDDVKELWEKAGMDPQSRSNKIFLPTEPDHHPTRSIHKGRHWESVSKELAGQMDFYLELGKKENWSQQQYKEALRDVLRSERADLRSGKRALNKNKREWADDKK